MTKRNWGPAEASLRRWYLDKADGEKEPARWVTVGIPS